MTMSYIAITKSGMAKPNIDVRMLAAATIIAAAQNRRTVNQVKLRVSRLRSACSSLRSNV